MTDKYLSIKETASGIYKEKGSKFIAFAVPVSNEDEVKNMLDKIKKEHYDARHHCYAYIIGKDEDLYKSYDNGEPRHSAGDPILNQIRSVRLRDILVVVVRYFGGTKLGRSGLIRAYKSAAQLALSKADMIEKVQTRIIIFKFQYEGINDLMHAIKHFNLEIIHQHYDNDCRITCLVPDSKVSIVKSHVRGIKAVRKIEELPG
jgi:uncharacterized YigZ family protein